MSGAAGSASNAQDVAGNNGQAEGAPPADDPTIGLTVQTQPNSDNGSTRNSPEKGGGAATPKEGSTAGQENPTPAATPGETPDLDDGGNGTATNVGSSLLSPEPSPGLNESAPNTVQGEDAVDSDGNPRRAFPDEDEEEGSAGLRANVSQLKQDLREREREERVDLSKDFLRAKARADAVWARVCHVAAPTYLLSPWSAVSMAVIVIFANSLVLYGASTDCTQPLDTYLRGNTGLAYLLVLFFAWQTIGPCPFKVWWPLWLGYNLILGFTIVWAIVGFAWFGLAGPCFQTSRELYNAAGAEVVLVFLGALAAVAIQVEWVLRYYCLEPSNKGDEEDKGKPHPRAKGDFSGAAATANQSSGRAAHVQVGDVDEEDGMDGDGQEDSDGGGAAAAAADG